MRKKLKRLIRRVLQRASVQKFVVERFWLAEVLHVLGLSYLRRFSEMDARYFRWLYALELSRDVGGDIVELGVGPGRFLVYCLSWLRETGVVKTYWGYDTFAGFPSIHEKDLDGMAEGRKQYATVGRYGYYSKLRLERRAAGIECDRYRLVEGDLTKTLTEVCPERVSFLYIDCDLYEGYKVGLEVLYERMRPGAVILFDEYEYVTEWPGARKAVDEFFSQRKEVPQQLPFSQSWYVVKQ